MVLFFVAAAAAVLLGAWCIVTNTLSLSRENAKLLKSILFVIFAAGLLGCVLSIIIFYAGAAGEKSADAAFARESFNLFIAIDAVFVLIALIVTTVSSLLKTKFRALIVVILPMWALIGLIPSAFGYMWLSFSDGLCALCFAAFSICASALLAFPAFLEIRERERVLSDRALRGEIIKARREKKLRRELKVQKRKNLREKKKKLRNKK